MWSSWFGRFKLTRPLAALSQPVVLHEPGDSLAALESQPAHRSPVMVLHDPGRLWPRSMAAVLADAAGQPCKRVDMRLPGGQRQPGRVQRLALPMAGAQGEALVKLYAVDHRVARQDADALTLTLAARADLLALLLGPMDQATLAALLRRLERALAAPHWACPQVLVLLQGAAQRHRSAIADHRWPHGSVLRPHWQVCKVGHGAPAVLQALREGWATAQGAGVAPAAPAGPASLEALAREPGVLAAALVDLAQGALLRPLAGPAGAALEHVARSLCVARSMQRFALGPGAPVMNELLCTCADQLQLLRPSEQQPGQAVLLLLAPGADLAALRAGLSALDSPAAGQPLAA